jgi:hypothetical protein
MEMMRMRADSLETLGRRRWRYKAGIIMPATLQYRAPKTYYGHWPTILGLILAPKFASQCS